MTIFGCDTLTKKKKELWPNLNTLYFQHLCNYSHFFNSVHKSVIIFYITVRLHEFTDVEAYEKIPKIKLQINK